MTNNTDHRRPESPPWCEYGSLHEHLDFTPIKRRAKEDFYRIQHNCLRRWLAVVGRGCVDRRRSGGGLQDSAVCQPWRAMRTWKAPPSESRCWAGGRRLAEDHMNAVLTVEGEIALSREVDIVGQSGFSRASEQPQQVGALGLA